MFSRLKRKWYESTDWDLKILLLYHPQPNFCLHIAALPVSFGLISFISTIRCFAESYNIQEQVFRGCDWLKMLEE